MADITGMLQAASGSGGGEPDPNFNQTVLLLHGDGTNGAQNNTFVDSSTNNFTITRNGNTTQGTFSPFSLPDGRWSNYFDTGATRLTTNPAAISSVSNNDFSIECWVYALRQTNTTAQGLVSYGSTSSTSGTQYLSFQLSSTGYLGVAYATGASITLADPSLFPINQWVHAVVCRSGSTLSLFVNGTRVNSTTTSATVGSTGNALVIGGQWYANADARQLNGYLSNVRIVNGSSAYDATQSSITVPTSPLTAIANTTLLTCQSNRFVDNSSNGYTISINGTPSVTPFSPFAPTAAYSASVNGGSGYFDGTGDYLTAPDDADFDFGSGAFTIECWYYKMANANQSLVDTRSTSSNGYLIWPESDGTVSVNVAASSRLLNGTIAFPLNAWTHLVFVKDGSNNFASFVNGVRDDLDTATTTLDAATSFTIGAKSLGISSVVPITGYLSGFRVVKGAAEYDPTSSTITVPTAPPTAVANTSLLCNFTNAGIFDNTGKNNLETVADAQIDTTIKKFGTGSMEFDGTGDYLISKDRKPTVGLGASEDFTLEMFFYPTNNSAVVQTLFQLDGTATRFWLRYYNSSGYGVYLIRQIGTASAANIVENNAALTLNTWYHIMVSRASGTVYLYIDGTYIDSGSMTDAFTDPIVWLGRGNLGSDHLYGFLDEVRFTRGVARHSGATGFTVPTSAYPDQ